MGRGQTHKQTHTHTYGHCNYCTALHCTALHCIALHCTTLHCTAVYINPPTALHYPQLPQTVLPAANGQLPTVFTVPGVWRVKLVFLA